MTLVVGTQNGVYRSETGTLDDLEAVLDSGVTLEVTFIPGLGAFAASKTGLYRSRDRGRTWSRLSVPEPEVFSVAASPNTRRLYAGTHPARLYVSRDDGATWSESMAFQALPSRGEWGTPRHRGRAHVRSLGVHPGVPGRLVAGVEVGGVHVSDDYGRTWTERRAGLEAVRGDDLQFDVHHVLVVNDEEYVVSCGGGLYGSGDGGRSWSRLAVDANRSYFQAAIQHQGTLYAAAQTHPPTLPMGRGYSSEDVEAALFESVDDGETFERVPYPGDDVEFVYAWTVSGGRVLAGTTEGRVLRREVNGWTTLEHVPEWVRSLAVVG